MIFREGLGWRMLVVVKMIEKETWRIQE